MSVHVQFAEDLALYALGALDDAERQTVEKHLEECASCRRELELLRGDLSLPALTTAGPQPPARARQRPVSGLNAQPRPPGAPPPGPPPAGGGAGGVGAAPPRGPAPAGGRPRV